MVKCTRHIHHWLQCARAHTHHTYDLVGVTFPGIEQESIVRKVQFYWFLWLHCNQASPSAATTKFDTITTRKGHEKVWPCSSGGAVPPLCLALVGPGDGIKIMNHFFFHSLMKIKCALKRLIYSDDNLPDRSWQQQQQPSPT